MRISIKARFYSHLKPHVLVQLDSVASALCGSVEGHLDGLLETIDSMQPDELLACLDSRAAAGGADGKAGA